MGLPPDQSERPLNLELEIATAEGDGSTLRRRITVKRFRLSPCGTAVTLGAHCHHSGDFQDFDSAAILQCVDPESAAVVDDLPAFLWSCYSVSRQGRLERLIAQFADELVVLLHLGRADGVLQTQEKQRIAAYLVERAGSASPPAAEIAPQLSWLESPSEERFHAALEQLSGLEPALRHRLVEIGREVVDVKTSRDGLEQPRLDALVSALLPGCG
jgi:hypothetical protein